MLSANPHKTNAVLRRFKFIPAPSSNFARKSVSESGLLLRARKEWQRSRGLGGEVAAFGQSADTIAGAEGKCFDGHGGLSAAAGDEAAAVAEKKILYVVRLVVGIDHRSFRIVAHAASPEQVHAEFLFARRI